ncbi:MAG: ubiquinone/menaquinone biosynthesis methyltransferase [Acidobacteria bacterium]|nr:ubiquinone/menaquinone biosynthesis methyltransferase [Acidobacteriota bacterium]
MSGYSYSTGEKQWADRMRAMFGSIARRYDLLNHLLSLNTDRYWRKVCVREVLRRTADAGPRVLDLGCGTADLSLAFPASSRVFAGDFSLPMLKMAKRKIRGAGIGRCVALLAADALMLPFEDAVFDAVVSAFVVRNLANRAAGVSEMKRVLRPGGLVGILDFGMPAMPLLGGLYRFYFFQVLPRIGRLVSEVSDAYRYLPQSVGEFPGPEALVRELEQAGFLEVQASSLTGGIAVLWTGRVPGGGFPGPAVPACRPRSL